MTNSVLEVKARKFGEINSLKRWMSERTSGVFILMLARILAANQDDPLAAPPHKKSSTTRGGKEKARHGEAAVLSDRMLRRPDVLSIGVCV